MRSLVVAAVWMYMLFAVVAEVAVFYLVSSVYIADGIMISLAASQAVAVVTFYMDLKGEPGPLRFVMILAVLFLTGLIIATVASLG